MTKKIEIQNNDSDVTLIETDPSTLNDEDGDNLHDNEISIDINSNENDGSDEEDGDSLHDDEISIDINSNENDGSDEEDDDVFPGNEIFMDINGNEEDYELILSIWKIFKEVSKLSLKMVLSYTFSFEVFFLPIILNAIDSSEENLAATTLVSIIMNTLTLFLVAHLFAMTPTAIPLIEALKIAEQDPNSDVKELEKRRIQISTIYRNGLLMGIPLVLPTMLGFFYSKDLLTHVFGQDETVAALAQEFLRPYAASVPLMMERMCAEQIALALGHSGATMRIGLTTFSIGMIAATWLGFGGFGVPKLGSLGVALGYLLESFLMAAFVTRHIVQDEAFSKFKFFSFFKHLKGNGSQLREMLRLGSSFSFTTSAELALTLATGIFAGLLGTLDQSTWNFAMQLVFFTLITSLTFAQGSSQELNRELGKKHAINASRVGRYALVTTMLWALPIPLILAIFPNILTFTLGSDVESIEAILKTLMPIISLGVVSDALRNNLLLQLRNLGDICGSSTISFTCLSLGVIAAGVLGLETKMGIYGVAAGYTGGITLATLCLLPRWLKRIQPDAIKEIWKTHLLPSSRANCFACLFPAPKNSKRIREITETSPLMRPGAS